MTFEKFKALIANQSPNAPRYHLLGWVETELVDSLFAEANLGINIDSWNYENDVRGAQSPDEHDGVRPAGSPQRAAPEISEDIEKAGAGWTTPIGDAPALAASIIPPLARWSAGNCARSGKRRAHGRLMNFPIKKPRARPLNGRRIRPGRRTISNACAAKRKFHPAPMGRSMAHRPPLRRMPFRSTAFPLNSLDDLLSGAERETYEALRRDQRDLAAIRGKAIWKFARRLKRWITPK